MLGLIIGVVTITYLFNQLWISALFSLIILIFIYRWLSWEFQDLPNEWKKISPVVFERKFGWTQKSIDFYVCDDDRETVFYRIYAFSKPQIFLARKLFHDKPAWTLSVALLYLVELIREIEGRPGLKLLVMLGHLLGKTPLYWLKKSKTKALSHAAEWHGIHKAQVKLALQQLYAWSLERPKKGRTFSRLETLLPSSIVNHPLFKNRRWLKRILQPSV